MKDSRDEFGDRMKLYESIRVSPTFFPFVPVVARLDGRSFSKYTKGMIKPYDAGMTDVMHQVTEVLLRETHARIAYTQSDEITLMWMTDEPQQSIFFNGKDQKMVSVLAGLASSAFSYHSNAEWGMKRAPYPHFDCRVWQVPNKVEAANVFLWRAIDARKNAVQGACQAVFAQSALNGVNHAKQLEMLTDYGIEFFSAYPASYRDGTFFRRTNVMKNIQFVDGSRRVMRTEIIDAKIPYFRRVTNRVEVIFDGEYPQVDREE